MPRKIQDAETRPVTIEDDSNSIHFEGRPHIIMAKTAINEPLSKIEAEAEKTKIPYIKTPVKMLKNLRSFRITKVNTQRRDEQDCIVGNVYVECFSEPNSFILEHSPIENNRYLLSKLHKKKYYTINHYVTSFGKRNKFYSFKGIEIEMLDDVDIKDSLYFQDVSQKAKDRMFKNKRKKIHALQEEMRILSYAMGMDDILDDILDDNNTDGISY